MNKWFMNLILSLIISTCAFILNESVEIWNKVNLRILDWVFLCLFIFVLFNQLDLLEMKGGKNE